MIVVVILALSLASCAPLYEMQADPLDVAWARTAALDYIADPPGGYWRSPLETEAAGGGDCEDLATYMLYRLGEDASLALVRMIGHTTGHVLVLYGGEYLEPQKVGRVYAPEEFELLRLMGYREAMAYATRNGRKSCATS